MLTSLLKDEVKGWFAEACHSELYASHLYQHIANQMERLGYFGTATFFRHESADELTHYQKIASYMNDMGTVAPVPAIEAIDSPVTSIMDGLMLAYNAEKDLLFQYQSFYDNAEEAGDCVTATFLIDYLQLQRRSVGEFGDLISRFEKNISDVFEMDEFIGDKVNG